MLFRSNMLLALLNIPQDGILGVTSALLFSESQQLCAYWWRDEKGHHPKLVDPQVLRAAIGAIPVDSGYLPEHVLRLGTSPRGQYWMLVSQPSRAYQLLIERKEQEHVSLELSLPGCLFFGLGEEYYLWAVKSGPLGAETLLYHFPLPNIAPSGLLCFGANTPSRVSWPSILPAFFLFLESPFNGHWAQEKSTVHPGDIRERLLTLAAQAPACFSDEELVPILDYRGSSQPTSLDAHLKRIVRG